MASTYDVPLDPMSHSRGHGHLHSAYSRDHFATWNSTVNGASPSSGQSPATGDHLPSRSEMNRQLHTQALSPYRHNHDHDHDHTHAHAYENGNGHTHSRSSESTYSLKSFMNGKSKNRPRGESDLGRPTSGRSAAGNMPFSPIQENPSHPPSSSSWFQLPEALTGLLIPLPYIFASLAYSGVVAQARKLPSTLADAVAETEDLPGGANGGQLLHACTLSSTTLLLVGLISKFRSGQDQPLDRRKAPSSSATSVGTTKTSLDSLWRICANIFGTLMPFYATMQLGGARSALVLLTAAAAGLGSLDQKPGKYSIWGNVKRTMRTRKTTCGSFVIGLLVDVYCSYDAVQVVLGYFALVVSLTAIPLPLPTVEWSVTTGSKSRVSWNTQAPGRTSLLKPSSPLISTPQDTLLTLGSGILLTVFTVLYASISSASPSLSHHSILFSTLSVASTTASVYFALPSALRSKRKGGLAWGTLCVAAFGVWEYPRAWQAYCIFPLSCILAFGATIFDTNMSSFSQPPSHDHSHSGHRHSHSHDHHLHGNHSRISQFLIARCTPGSILHSIMIEKDSRRIAYFGMLNLAFMMVQFFYGFVSGSLGLLTDSIHMLFDCAGLAVGLAAAVMSKWRPNTRFPYGYGKVDTLSGFANGVFLLLVSVEIIFDASERLWEGHELQRLNELLIVSVLGFLVNIVGLTAFGHAHHGHGHSHDHDHGDHGHSHSHSHENENMQGIFLHILADALGSVAVIISTLLTKYYGWSGWDPIASCIIAILIFASAIPLVKSSGMRLMLSLPADVEYGIRNTLQELSSLRGVVGYAVPKFWLEDEGAAHAEVHAHEHDHCDLGSSHNHSESHKHHHSQLNDNHNLDHDGHLHSHGHHNHDHDHDHDHDHGHSHSHDHTPRGQKILGIIHIIASRVADLEDVRERTAQFLKSRNMDVVIHIEREGDGRCWCGGGIKAL